MYQKKYSDLSPEDNSKIIKFGNREGIYHHSFSNQGSKGLIIAGEYTHPESDSIVEIYDQSEYYRPYHVVVFSDKVIVYHDEEINGINAQEYHGKVTTKEYRRDNKGEYYFVQFHDGPLGMRFYGASSVVED